MGVPTGAGNLRLEQRRAQQHRHRPFPWLGPASDTIRPLSGARCGDTGENRGKLRPPRQNPLPRKRLSDRGCTATIRGEVPVARPSHHRTVVPAQDDARARSPRARCWPNVPSPGETRPDGDAHLGCTPGTKPSRSQVGTQREPGTCLIGRSFPRSRDGPNAAGPTPRSLSCQGQSFRHTKGKSKEQGCSLGRHLAQHADSPCSAQEGAGAVELRPVLLLTSALTSR